MLDARFLMSQGAILDLNQQNQHTDRYTDLSSHRWRFLQNSEEKEMHEKDSGIHVDAVVGLAELSNKFRLEK